MDVAACTSDDRQCERVRGVCNQHMILLALLTFRTHASAPVAVMNRG
jgi:hypothetical protein